MTDTTDTSSASADRARTASLSRTTRESSVELSLDLDGTGQVDVSTTVPFFDHMLTALGTHARFDLTVRATGDTHIDAHHTVEDTSIVLGQALREALGDKKGITRFGDALVPLDEALAQAVVDLSGRPYCVHSGESEAQALHLIGGHFTGSLTRHVFESLAHHAAICLHIRLIEGRDPHHIVEAQFKALARALRTACARDERVLDVPSTKGAL
ncbi:MAG TPA: imidazoleglycerol-phosphate dehydratase HisB [Candidatus Brachybacterium merdavium]|uniref:Imidazoleglycerol-phosphate dehydratase n=1 Tax=Candidatus Brachybacterium merdavium TaxID=2838513 RepID=A0A9D2LCK8_9MICO|nr:imidazoleglycerol-phosphate dehydratase HisB [Candidatus Brachybacterium merdavium]